MSVAVAVSAVVPVLAAPSVRAEQVTQLVLGETASRVDSSGEWLRVRTAVDDYDGWLHRGYVRVVSDEDGRAWRARADWWSDGLEVELHDGSIRVPLRARVAADGPTAVLPDGRTGRVTAGALRTHREVVADNAAVAPEQWALERFRGAPYQWGGLTPWGVDCSGLVQTAFLARGLVVPRDSSAQASFGDEVPLEAIRPGDLLFFRSEGGGPTITHVAFAADGDAIVHSTIACGGVVHESFAPGTRAGDALRPRLTAARRFAAR